MTADPLWLRLRNHPSLFCLHPTPSQLAVLLDELIIQIYDTEHRDRGAICEWLKREANAARDAAERHSAEDSNA